VGFSYSFNIDLSSITRKLPKEYHIRKYVKVDGEQVWEEMEIVRAAFKLTKDERTPTRLDHLIFTKKTLDLPNYALYETPSHEIAGLHA